MKNRKWIAVILLAVLGAAAFIIGFWGNFELVKPAQAETEQDRLVGVFITKAYLDLFDSDAYFEDHIADIIKGGSIREEEASAYRQRLYASGIVDSHHETPSFGGIEGIAVFCAYVQDEDGSYWMSSGDEAYSDGNMHLTDVEELERMELEGTVYSSVLSGWDCFYVNPMYQTADGSLYIVSGTGCSFSGNLVPGMAGTQTIKESKETIVNGEKKATEAEIVIHFSFIAPPVSTAILQFDSENHVIAQDTYLPNALPQAVAPLKDTQYIIVETNHAEGVTRELVQQQDDYAYAFSVREDGICIKQYIEINWKPDSLT